MKSMRDLLLAPIVAVTMMAGAPASAQQPKPNIVFILADNLGYGDIGVYGGGDCAAPRRRASIGSPPKACG
jgi:hypothetical protein